MKIKKIFKSLIIILSLIIIFLSIYINKNFNNISFEQLIYTVLYTEGTSFSAIVGGIIFVTTFVLFSFTLIIILVKFLKNSKTKIFLKLFFKDKFITFDLLKITKVKSFMSILFLFIFSILISINLLKIDDYIKGQLSSTNLFDEYYVDSKNADIEFPEEKQNLIYIFVESLETTNVSLKNGGALKESYIPNLEEIALENINFSNNSKLGGALSANGTTFTAAAMIAQTSGVPLKVSIDSNKYKGFGQSLPGVYSLGEILEENGYTNYLMLGSDADFGGRKDYFDFHGNYVIYDYNYAKENELIDEDYYVWWGYEDRKLYEFAKDKLKEISKKDEPFNFTLLTADTHFVDGYQDESCPQKFSNKYANSFYCADLMLSEFLDWIEEQAFYNNTTIIISGDHLTMQQGFYSEIDSSFQRSIYNVIINSKTKAENEKNRIFSTFDLFPTTLSAIGADIDGERLGLGTNLFSEKETLMEELGYIYFNQELQKKSFFYDNYLLGDTYYKMQDISE